MNPVYRVLSWSSLIIYTSDCLAGELSYVASRTEYVSYCLMAL